MWYRFYDLAQDVGFVSGRLPTDDPPGTGKQRSRQRRYGYQWGGSYGTGPVHVYRPRRLLISGPGFRREILRLFALAPRQRGEGKREGSASIAAPCPSPGGLRPPTSPRFRGARCRSQSTTRRIHESPNEVDQMARWWDFVANY